MSKSTKIIAGAGVAALAIAAVPAAASFAAVTGTATYETTVDPSISISVNGLTDSKLATSNIEVGGSDLTKSHTIRPTSNALYGYAVTATADSATTLANTVASNTDTFAYTTSAITADGDNDGWNLTTSGTTGEVAAGIIDLKTTATNIAKVKDTSTTEGSSDITIAFKVKAKDNQAAGTYQRTVTYEINALDSSYELVDNN